MKDLLGAFRSTFSDTEGELLQVDCPERRLLVAIIIRAILDALQPYETHSVDKKYRCYTFGRWRDYRRSAWKFLTARAWTEWSLPWILSQLTEEPEVMQKKIICFVQTNRRRLKKPNNPKGLGGTVLANARLRMVA